MRGTADSVSPQRISGVPVRNQVVPKALFLLFLLPLLLAVGGVTAENTAELLARGFCGVGVGGNLYDKKLIAQGDYAGLTALAKQFTEATK